MADGLDAHYAALIRGLRDGRVVPLLGAGASQCGRRGDTAWTPGAQLPSGGELARYLAVEGGYPSDDTPDLARVSQYIAVMSGSGPLYEKLRELFAADYPTTPLHRLFAGLPARFREKGWPPRYQLLVTTNYDDALERAFQEAGEPFDLLTYMAEGEQKGKFLHVRPDGEAHLIEKPNEYLGLSLTERSVILKMHGAVDRANPDRDSFVITEDHYIDYLTRTDIANLIPITLAAKLRKSHFLFLGYSLRDWNLRVILHRIWGEQRLTYRSWAVQLNPQALDREFWRKRDVEILDLRLEDYVAGLSGHLDALAGPAA